MILVNWQVHPLTTGGSRKPDISADLVGAFREEMEKVIAREALPQTAEVCRVVPAALGDAIGDFAAVAVAQMHWEEMNNV